MRTIDRIIVSAIIFSKDEKILMGKKDPNLGGVYPGYWHIPGGGVDEGETLEQAVTREVKEEVGIDISIYKLVNLPFKGSGSSEKTLKSGETVLANMEFNYFEVRITDKTASDIELQLEDDLVQVEWFTKQQLKSIEQIPGGKEFFLKAGYL